MSDDALLRLAVAMERLASVAEKVYNQCYPEILKREAIITRPDDEKRELLNDKPSDKWVAETEAATPQGKSRFAERFSETGDSESVGKEGSSVSETASKSARPRRLPKYIRPNAGRPESNSKNR